MELREGTAACPALGGEGQGGDSALEVTAPSATALVSPGCQVWLCHGACRVLAEMEKLWLHPTGAVAPLSPPPRVPIVTLVSPGQGAGGTRAGTPHKGAFGAFLGSGGSARSRDDPGGAEPLWLFPLPICAPSPARCCDKPRPPPTSQPAPIPLRRCCHRSLAAPFVRGTKPGSQGTRVYRGIDSCHRGNIQEQPLAPSHGDRDGGEAGLSPPSS